jgi:hypothetical protein
MYFPADFIDYKNLNSYAAVHYTVSYVSLIGVQVDSSMFPVLNILWLHDSQLPVF